MSESNSKIEKIKKSSHVALVLTQIIRIILMIGAVISAGVGFFCLGAREFLDQEFVKAIAAGELTWEDLTIRFDSSFLSGNIYLGQEESGARTLGIYLLVMCILLLCVWAIMHFVGKVFQQLRDSYSPFGPEIIKSLKVAFVLITILVLWSSLLIGALVGISLWCVFQIFEYGCELQRQSDETL